MMLVLVVLRAKARNVWIRLGMSVFTILSSPLLLNLFVQIRICHICHAYMRIEIQVLQFNYGILKKKKTGVRRCWPSPRAQGQNHPNVGTVLQLSIGFTKNYSEVPIIHKRLKIENGV